MCIKIELIKSSKLRTVFIEQIIQSNAVIHVLNWMELIKKNWTVRETKYLY